MSNLLIIGSGLSGLSAAYFAAKKGIKVTIVTDDLPERSQSVMAAGGINCFDKKTEDDASLHIEETIKSGCGIANQEAVKGLCEDAESILTELKNLGVLFHMEEDGSISRRAFGGQSVNRTAYSGASTGKQIVTAFVRAIRRYEKEGLITFSFRSHFIAPIIQKNKMIGAVVYSDDEGKARAVFADKVILATGGLNGLYGNTTGSKFNNAYAVCSLFEQGLAMANLEFVQFHPTTIRTKAKNMLISEAARGEGGRLFYLDEKVGRVYFMEDKYGERGNLQTRDIVSREMFAAPSQVYLDISFLGEKVIKEKLGEIEELCKTYIDLDPIKEPIPVEPAVHFFMGGVAVNNRHKTNIENLYAVGECASAYHGANRLGGNSLLAAIHSAKVAIEDIDYDNNKDVNVKNFDLLEESEEWNDEEYIKTSVDNYLIFKNSQAAIKKLNTIMLAYVGIVRSEACLNKAIEEIQALKRETGLAIFDLARATALSALYRCESRGSHYREDCKETKDEYATSSIAIISGGAVSVGVGKNGIQN